MDPDQPFPGFALTHKEEKLHVCLNDPRLLFAGVMPGGFSFVLLFVVAFGAGSNPSVWLMILVWAFVLVVSAVAYAKAWPLGGVPRELVLDESAGTVELFRRSRDVPDRVISTSSIKAVVVEVKEQADSDGDVTRTYVPTILYQNAEGIEGREVLGRWTQAVKADTVASSLRLWLEQSGHRVADCAPDTLEGEKKEMPT